MFQDRRNETSNSNGDELEKIRTVVNTVIDNAQITHGYGGENFHYNNDDLNQGFQKLSDLLDDKQKLQDTHTRRTFLVEIDLLNQLDEIADKTNNKSFKTEFINYVIKRGLDELSR